MFLRKWGFEFIGTEDGTEAWRILQERDGPRLAILDWKLSGMDGLAICRGIRQRVGQPTVYIVMLTGQSQKAEIQRGLDAGVDHYMIKPFEPEELRAVLLQGCRVVESAGDPR